MTRRALAGAAAILASVALSHARAAAQAADSALAEPSIPPAVGFVNDRAAVMDESTRARLEAFLDQLRTKTGAEFAVLTVRTTAPLSPAEYKVRVFEAWGIGRKGHDDGLLMLVALEEREVRFETGYGLEGVLPDGFQSRLFREEMAPRFRAGDFGAGIVAGALRCATKIAAAQSVTLTWDGRELRYDSASSRSEARWILPLAFLIFFVVLPLAIGRGRRRRRWGPWFGGPWGGGYWGGGFGGGGFGGGGFGGGSFGGFGGGASGGGGGGGRW